MAQNEKSHKTPHIFGDIALTAVAVSIVAITFYGVSGLTPKAASQVATNGAAVLGVSTKQRDLTYFPPQTDKIPYISNFTLSGNTSLGSNATINVAFSPLEASTYTFTAVTIKNTSTDYKRVQLNPSFSLDGSYTKISVTFAGMTTEIVSPEGTVTPLDLVVPPSSAASLDITLQPTVKLATPVTLTLDFTEVP